MVAESIEGEYQKLLEVLENPTKDNWYERYNRGLRLERVEQGRRLVAETPVLRGVSFWGDMQNERFKEAYLAFISGRGNVLRFAPVRSHPEWAQMGK